MRDGHRIILSIAIAAFLVLEFFLTSGKAAGQSLIQSWSDDTQLAFEWYHPSFSRIDYSALTNISFFSLSTPAGRNLWFKADIPFSYYNNKNDRNKAKFEFGNPYVGIANWLPGSPLILNLGIRFPLCLSGSSIIDKNSVYYRAYASTKATWVLQGNLRLKKHFPSGFSYQFIFGSFVILTKQRRIKSEAFINYGGHVRYQQGNFLIGGGIKGLASLNSILYEGLSNQFYLEVGSPQDKWTPSMYLAFPLDNKLSGWYQLNFVFGLRVNLHFHT